MGGLLPDASRARLLGGLPERRCEIGRAPLGRIADVLLAENRELGFERGGACTYSLVVGFLVCAVGSMGGELSLALRQSRPVNGFRDAGGIRISGR